MGKSSCLQLISSFPASLSTTCNVTEGAPVDVKHRQQRAEVGSQDREMPPSCMQCSEPSFHPPWPLVYKGQMAGTGAANVGGGQREAPRSQRAFNILEPFLCPFSFGYQTDEQNPISTLVPALRLAGLERVHCYGGQRSLTATRTANCPGSEATERPNPPASALNLCLWLPQAKGQQGKGRNMPALVGQGNTLLP